MTAPHTTGLCPAPNVPKDTGGTGAIGDVPQGVQTDVPLRQEYVILVSKSRKENPQKPTQLSSRSHPRHLVGKRTAQKTPS